MKIDENLNKVFNIKSEEEVQLPQVSPIEERPVSEDDFQLARETLRDLISTNTDILDSLVSVAKGSESPRAFEVAGQLIKTQAEIAQSLLNAHKQKKDIDKVTNAENNNIKTQNNIVFSGSTSELMKMISMRTNAIDHDDK